VRYFAYWKTLRFKTIIVILVHYLLSSYKLMTSSEQIFSLFYQKKHYSHIIRKRKPNYWHYNVKYIALKRSSPIENMKPQLINLDFIMKGDFMMKEITAPYFVNIHHFHDDYELVYVVESSGKRIIGNSIGNFKKQDMVLVSPSLPHAWFNDREYYDNSL